MSTTFLQSAEWEEFQKTLGRKTWRAAGNLVIRHDLPAGLKYLYTPYPDASDDTSEFFEEIEKFRKEENPIFLKIDRRGTFAVPSSFSLRRSNSIQPRKTAVLNLRSSEEDLLRSMHEKTRYNIRLAQKRGVGVFAYSKDSRKDLPEIFWKMLKVTASREKFHTHERIYYDKLLSAETENFKNELFFAEYQRKILAAALVNFYKPAETSTYLHGASSRDYKEVMAPHLLHWHIIQESQKRGLHHYDFWGIDEKRWAGLTRFKMGFGGEVVEYPLSIDIVYRPGWYGLYRLIRKLT